MTYEGTAPGHAHGVLFHRDVEHLAVEVLRHVREALDADGVAVVVATADHHAAFAPHLPDDDRLVLLDADELLGSFHRDRCLDPDAFDDTVGALLRRLAVRAAGRPVHAYGEMVDLLWQVGDVLGAIELEERWNRLNDEIGFALLCGYDAARLDGDHQRDVVAEVCRLHSHVVGDPPAVGCRSHTFAATINAPRAARLFVADVLVELGRDHLVDHAVLLTAELATNAVLHARSSFTVSITVGAGGRARIAVIDGSAHAPLQHAIDDDRLSGRGMALVHGLADRWGTDRSGAGKVVWFELDG